MAFISLNNFGSAQNPTIDRIPLNGGQSNFVDSRFLDSNAETSVTQYIDIIPANDYNLGIKQDYVNQSIKIGDIDNNSSKNLSLTLNNENGDIALTGAEILKNTKGNSVSQNLRLLINGTYYKIPLHAD